MKKLILLALILTSCQTTTVVEESGACDAPDYTYPLLTYESWNGIEFGLPWCWTANEEGETLRLEHGEGEAWVELSIPTGVYDGPSEGYMRSDEDGYSSFNFGGDLLLKTNNPDHSNVQDILYSISTL